MADIQISGVTLAVTDMAFRAPRAPGAWMLSRLTILGLLAAWLASSAAVLAGYASIDLMIGVGVCLVIYVVGNTTANLLLNRAFREAYIRTPIGSAPVTWSFSEKEITQRSEAISSVIPWSSVCAVEEAPERFVFVLGPVQRAILPKRFFASQTEIEAVRALAAARQARP